MNETYMGDGVYAEYDGYHVVLEADRRHRICLDPSVWNNVVLFGLRHGFVLPQAPDRTELRLAASNPVVVHQAPPGQPNNLMPCCGLPGVDMPRGDYLTSNPDAVTCKGGES